MPGLKLGREAQAKFDEAKANPDHQGFLDKKGAKRKNWNNRWFVLKDNYLFYCKTSKTPPQGIINLHGCTVSKLEGPTARPYSFSLLAPKSVSVDAKWTNRTYFFAATSTTEMEEWMNSLIDSGRKSVERSQHRDKQEPETPPQPAKEVVKQEESKKTDKEPKDSKSDEKKHKKKKKSSKPKEEETEEKPTEPSESTENAASVGEEGEKKKKKKKKLPKVESDEEEEEEVSEESEEEPSKDKLSSPASNVKKDESSGESDDDQ